MGSVVNFLFAWILILNIFGSSLPFNIDESETDATESLSNSTPDITRKVNTLGVSANMNAVNHKMSKYSTTTPKPIEEQHSSGGSDLIGGGHNGHVYNGDIRGHWETVENDGSDEENGFYPSPSTISSKISSNRHVPPLFILRQPTLLTVPPKETPLPVDDDTRLGNPEDGGQANNKSKNSESEDYKPEDEKRENSNTTSEEHVHRTLPLHRNSSQRINVCRVFVLDTSMDDDGDFNRRRVPAMMLFQPTGLCNVGPVDVTNNETDRNFL